MSGGSGTIIGTVVGAFVIGVINDGMTMCGVSEFWQKVIRWSGYHPCSRNRPDTEKSSGEDGTSGKKREQIIR